LTHQVADKWRSGLLSEFGNIKPPEEPKRSENLSVVDPGKMKKRGKGGTMVQFFNFFFFNKYFKLKVFMNGFLLIYLNRLAEWHCCIL
jgi:hypothetical protein